METPKNVLKEPGRSDLRVEEVTLKRVTQPLSRVELAKRLGVPQDATFLVAGRPIHELTVQWLENPEAVEGEGVNVTPDDKPWLICKRCPGGRRIHGRGPWKQHEEWHAKQDAAKPRKRP